MKNLKFSLSLMLLLFASSLFSQLTYKRTFWSEKFYENGEKVKFKNVESIMKRVPVAHQEFLKGKMKKNLGIIASLGGLSLEILGLLEDLKEKENDKSLQLQLAGLGLMGLSIYFDQQKTEHYINATNIFNQENSKTSLIVSPSITKNGIGLTARF